MQGLQTTWKNRQETSKSIIPHRINIWHIYLPFSYIIFIFKCRWIYQIYLDPSWDRFYWIPRPLNLNPHFLSPPPKKKKPLHPKISEILIQGQGTDATQIKGTFQILPMPWRFDPSLNCHTCGIWNTSVVSQIPEWWNFKVEKKKQTKESRSTVSDALRRIIK